MDGAILFVFFVHELFVALDDTSLLDCSPLEDENAADGSLVAMKRTTINDILCFIGYSIQFKMLYIVINLIVSITSQLLNMEKICFQ